jgi:hypothetical protein
LASFTYGRALGIKEVESLALDEVAKKMTGRRAASLGRTELAYIVEVHHAQMKDKLAVRCMLMSMCRSST